MLVEANRAQDLAQDDRAGDPGHRAEHPCREKRAKHVLRRRGATAGKKQDGNLAPAIFKCSRFNLLVSTSRYGSSLGKHVNGQTVALQETGLRGEGGEPRRQP
jgi:hypothetical protein